MVQRRRIHHIIRRDAITSGKSLSQWPIEVPVGAFGGGNVAEVCSPDAAHTAEVVVTSRAYFSRKSVQRDQKKLQFAASVCT